MPENFVEGSPQNSIVLIVSRRSYKDIRQSVLLHSSTGSLDGFLSGSSASQVSLWAGAPALDVIEIN